MMTGAQNLTGYTFDGYRVTRHLARGGMADVYVAQEAALGREVVLKVMLPALTQDQSFATRFRREAQSTAQLSHPNIVQIYRIGAAPDGRPYLAMQYVRGGSLQQKLVTLAQEERMLSTTAALALVRQIADALHVAHGAGIVHRDVKPSNILLHENGAPVLTDLGIAAVSAASRLTRTGDVMGTPHYMSPEQAGGKPLDGRSDIYSLGVILYELLAGAVPFQGESPLAVLHQHVYEPPPFLGEIRPDLSAATLSVVERCLQKDPERRWENAAALVAGLKIALAAEGAREAISGTYKIDIKKDTITRHGVVQATEVLTSPGASPSPPPAIPSRETAVSPAGDPPSRRIPAWAYGAGGVVLLLLIGLLLIRPFGNEDSSTAAGIVDSSRPAFTATSGATARPTDFPTLTPLPSRTPETEAVADAASPTAVAPSPTPRSSATSAPPVGRNGRIAFQSNRDGDFEIYVMDQDGGNQQQLTVNTADDQYPVAAPDGGRIAFQSERDGNQEIYVMAADGSEQIRLTTNPRNDRLPTWSPDSSQIAFLSDRDGDYDLYIINADGSGLRQVTDSDLRIGHVSWSVDDQLVYNAGTWEGETWELYTRDASGGNERQLTANGVSDWSPEWSPDGRSILYLSAEGQGDPALYLFDTVGGQSRMLYNSADYEWGADWTPDGRIIFTRERDNFSYIYIMDGDGSNARLIAERGSYPTWVSDR